MCPTRRYSVLHRRLLQLHLFVTCRWEEHFATFRWLLFRTNKSRLQLDRCWFFTWSCIEANRGEITSNIGCFAHKSGDTFWCIHVCTRGAMWKIKDFPYPVGRFTNRSSPLKKQYSAWRWWSVNSEIANTGLTIRTHCKKTSREGRDCRVRRHVYLFEHKLNITGLNYAKDSNAPIRIRWPESGQIYVISMEFLAPNRRRPSR